MSDFGSVYAAVKCERYVITRDRIIYPVSLFRVYVCYESANDNHKPIHPPTNKPLKLKNLYVVLDMTRIISFILSIILPLLNLIGITNDYIFSVDTSSLDGEMPNMVSNVNVWDMGTQFINAKNDDNNDIYDFVEYVQLMECTGGNYDRDLFKNPYDRTVLDDYDFSRLIENCRGILALGAKPHIKTGNVPMKYTANSRCDTTFAVNPLEPDDYDVYYNYLFALFSSLVEEFGRDEVLLWHFGVMTEYENGDWFNCGSAEKNLTAYCKIYDYTVDALQKAVGENVYVGAHSMTVTEGSFDEREFIKHCAIGTNYKTGKTGSRLCYLSFSYYETTIGTGSNGMPLPDCVELLRSAAEKYGLKNLDYGIDEGRVLASKSGRDSDQLSSRTVGYQWQAATDARLYKQGFDNGLSYFSSWDYKSNGLNSGNPTLSFHIASCISRWKGAKRAAVAGIKNLGKTEVEAMAAVGDGTVYVMTYNYKNSLSYNKNADVKIKIALPGEQEGKATVTVYTIDDSCNYFDDWLVDKEKYGFSDEIFGWSPDCPCIGATMSDPDALKFYRENLEEKYAACSVLEPKEITCDINEGEITLERTIGANVVEFYEIEY